MAKPNWYTCNLSWCAGGQVRLARGDHSWGLRFRFWRPGTYAGLPGGIRFTDHYLPLWPATPDYEAIAVRHGWARGGDADGFVYHVPTWGSWKAAASWSGDPDQEPNGEHDRPAIYSDWQECCECEDLT